MMRKLTFVLPFLAALIAVGCSEKKTPISQAPEVVRDVKLVDVQNTTVPDYVEAVGTVRALQTSRLSAQVAGAIVSIRAQEGQRVGQGEVLIVLDDAQQRAAVQRASAGVSSAQQDIAAAAADYALANSTLGRYQNLYEKKSVSPHEMDEMQARAKSAGARSEQAQAGIAQARALEQQARAGLSYTRIRAPFDGVVTAKHVDLGTLASPGLPLLTIEDTHRFRLEASVDEGDIRLIKLGATAPVVVDALGGELQGKVVQIVPAADSASRSFIVKLELPSDSRLHSGFFGRARFARGQRDAVMVPRTALLDHGQLRGVYVVGADGRIALRFVTVGKPAGENIELLSGVTPGERLVASHAGRDLAGKKVAN
jgi:membrane fusion protein, multidrug efflux system